MSNQIKHHIERWNSTRSFLPTIDSDYPEWVVTVAFYATLHGVQALLLQRGWEPKSHTERTHALKNIGRGKSGDCIGIRKLSNLYKTLREASNHARYEPQVTNYTNMDSVQKEIIDDIFYDIEKLLVKLIKSSSIGKLAPITLRTINDP